MPPDSFSPRTDNCLYPDSEFVPTDCPFPVSQWYSSFRPHYSGDKPCRNLTGLPETIKFRSYTDLLCLYYIQAHHKTSPVICQCFICYIGLKLLQSPPGNQRSGLYNRIVVYFIIAFSTFAFCLAFYNCSKSTFPLISFTYFSSAIHRTRSVLLLTPTPHSILSHI
jgi:hypothetical protein